MYEEFYGLSRLPFQLLPDPDFFYRSRKHEKALTYLEYGVFERAGFIVITGEIGTGKTTLLRYLLRSLSGDIPTALINQTFLSPEEFLRMLCQEFSLPHEGQGKPELIDLFGRFLVDQYQQGHYVILILDEAQNLPLNTLEEIRMLSNLDADNERLLQIILVGQPPLRHKLHQEELRQLLQRVEVSYHLEPLDAEELQEYIRYRLKTAGAEDPEIFEAAAVNAIYASTGGIPRLINSMCHRCLVYGFADGRKKITLDLFEKMLADRTSEGLFPQAAVSPSARNDALDSEPSDLKNNPTDAISPTHLAATPNHLTEISGASIKAVELAAAGAANTAGEANLASLKRQLAEERGLREAIEHRLNRTEDTLANLEKALPQKNRKTAGHDSADPQPGPVTPIPSGPPEKDRTWLSLNPTQSIILFLILILAITLIAILVFWRPRGDGKNEPPPELKSSVLEHNPAQANVPPQKINPSRPQPEHPLPAAADAAARAPDLKTSKPETLLSAAVNTDPRIPGTTTAQPVFRNSRIKTDPESKEIVPSAVDAMPDKVLAAKPQVSSAIEAEKYVCVVKLANVRAKPDIEARIVGRIRQGTEVEVIGKEQKWIQFKFQGKESAWIYSTLLRRQDQVEADHGQR